MKKTRDEMLTNIIRKWGFEHNFTIDFAVAMEDDHFTNKMLTDLYRGLMDLQGPLIFCRPAGRRRSRRTIIPHLSSFVNRQIVQTYTSILSQNSLFCTKTYTKINQSFLLKLHKNIQLYLCKILPHFLLIFHKRIPVSLCTLTVRKNSLCKLYKRLPLNCLPVCEVFCLTSPFICAII